MFLINAINNKSKKIISEEMLFNYLKDFEIDDEDRKSLVRHFRNGDTIYYASNPYDSELNNKNSLLFGKEQEEVKSTFYNLREET